MIPFFLKKYFVCVCVGKSSDTINLFLGELGGWEWRVKSRFSPFHTFLYWYYLNFLLNVLYFCNF